MIQAVLFVVLLVWALWVGWALTRSPHHPGQRWLEMIQGSLRGPDDE